MGYLAADAFVTRLASDYGWQSLARLHRRVPPGVSFRGLGAVQIPESAWGTPIYDGYSLGLRTLLEPTPVSVAFGRKYLLLVTDGMPTLKPHCIGPGDEASPVDTAAILARVYRAGP